MLPKKPIKHNPNTLFLSYSSNTLHGNYYFGLWNLFESFNHEGTAKPLWCFLFVCLLFLIQQKRMYKAWFPMDFWFHILLILLKQLWFACVFLRSLSPFWLPHCQVTATPTDLVAFLSSLTHPLTLPVGRTVTASEPHRLSSWSHCQKEWMAAEVCLSSPQWAGFLLFSCAEKQIFTIIIFLKSLRFLPSCQAWLQFRKSAWEHGQAIEHLLL